MTPDGICPQMRKGGALALSLSLAWSVWPSAHAESSLALAARLGVPMSCAAYAHIQSAEYPETIWVYSEGRSPRSVAEASRAALGLKWLQRRDFAEKNAVAAFNGLHGRPATKGEVRDERSRWVHKLMSYPDPLREAVGMNCEGLFAMADSSRPSEADRQ